MFKNVVILALLFISTGVYASTTVANQKKHVVVHKEAKEARQLTQKLFFQKSRDENRENMKLLKEGKMATVQRGPGRAKPAAKTAGLRGSKEAAVHTESLTSAKTRFFSPNKGFVEYIMYDDWYCSSPTQVSSNAVNFCYYDDSTGGAWADVVLFESVPNVAQFMGVNGFVFNDASCSTVNTTETYTGYSWGSYGTVKGDCYNYYTTNGTLEYSYSMDHVLTPTNVTSDTAVTFLEYKTEAACNNWNNNQLIGQSALDIADFGCSEYLNVGEYFTFSCSNSVVQANVYDDADCSNFLRTDDMSDMCTSDAFTYASRLVCDSTV